MATLLFGRPLWKIPLGFFPCDPPRQDAKRGPMQQSCFSPMPNRLGEKAQSWG
jgi:hypothetical protein